MSASLGHGANAEPDMTPILDMVFQLITFFMLVTNFKAASLDLDLKLPVVGSAAPVDSGGTDDLLILNIDARGQLKVYGQVRSDLKGYIANEAQASRLAAKRKGLNLTKDDDLPSRVVLRADHRTPFALLNLVILHCQEAGYRKFSLKAMNKEDGT